MLRDGRVFVAGGANNGAAVDLLAAEMYNPQTNAWTALPTPPGMNPIGDAACCVLPDGRVIIGALSTAQTAIYDPTTNAWTAGANMVNGRSNEETWTLLQDQTIMTCDCAGHPKTEKYLIPANQWITTGNTPADLVEAGKSDRNRSGSGCPRRSSVRGGRHGRDCSLYDAAGRQPAWNVGGRSVLPGRERQATRREGRAGVPHAERPRVVRRRASGRRVRQLPEPTSFYEFNPTTNSLAAVSNPPTNGGLALRRTHAAAPDRASAVRERFGQRAGLYAGGLARSGWKPSITSAPATVKRGLSYTLLRPTD